MSFRKPMLKLLPCPQILNTKYNNGIVKMKVIGYIYYKQCTGSGKDHPVANKIMLA
jgi:hypothetical protein